MMNDRRMGAESRGLEQRECGDEEDGVKLVEKDLVELTPGPGDWTIDARNNGVGQSESRKGKEFDKIYPLTFGVQPSRPSCRHTEVVAQTGGICSVSQIRKARDSFQSRDTIAFLKQLALMPRSDAGSVDFFKNEATILAYRRETFGEFDETNARTFGVQPSQPPCGHEVVAESGGVCSASQIREARDSFQSRDTLAFLKQLALMPRSDEGGVDFFKNEATVLAYRREMFGEFDATYAQAFGVKPARPSRGPMDVMAETQAVCSASQIREAGDSFQSRDTLAFLKQLALMPRGDEGGVDFFKNEATVLAYRRETFGEFDKTYARAFGVKPAHPSRGPTDVMAETRAVCSASQIREAGDSFESRGTLAFLKQLALMPRSDKGGVDFLKNEATILVYRRETFGEFDETYARASGVKPAHPSCGPMDVMAETQVVCSGSQIREARDSFQSRDTLAFLKQLALMPRSDEGGVDFFKNEATVLAYRREMFGEFDGTYALAFGVKPARPSRRPTEVVAQTDRAPLGGPLVIAEALGERKNSAKPKDQANKDRYLSKRRDKQSVMKIRKIGQAVSSMQSAYVDLADGNYVLQKRAKTASKEQQIPAKLEQTLAIRKDASLLSGRDATDEKVMSTEDKPDVVRFNMADSPSLASGSKAVLPSSFSDSFPVKQSCTLAQEAEATFNLRDERSPSFPAVVEEVHGREQVHNSDSGGHVLPTIGTEIHGQNSRMCLYMGAKKAKLLKHRIGELGSEESSPGENKRKKLSRTATNTHLLQKWIANGKVGGSSNGRVTGKTVRLGLCAEEDFQLELQKEDGRTNGMLHGMQPMVAVGSVELKLRQLLGDLQALSVNPFHGMERNNLAITRGVFLKFRSTVFQKSLTLSTPAKMDTNEVHFPKSPPGRTAGSDNTFRKNIKDLQSSKPTKPLVRPDDSAKGGRKRGPSDRQEELAAKRVKKINDMKSLAAKRGAAQKAPGAGRDGNETVAFGQLKPLKPDCVKNALSPAKAAEPMMLVMRFPPKTTLPSASELKARLARFGPLDHSRTRIVWKTSTCQVVFVYKVDAEAAHRHLTGNNTLFSKLNVRCHIWPLEAAKTLVLESKFRREHAPTETLHSRDSAAVPPLQHPSAQLKSHLKKTAGDGAGTTMVDNGGRNTFNNASFADSGAYSSCHGMGLDGWNQKVVSPSPLPILPPLPPVSTPQFLNAQNSMCIAAAASRNIHNFSPKTNLDIAPEMLSLLTKCNDIVTYLRTYLGYAPYRPL